MRAIQATLLHAALALACLAPAARAQTSTDPIQCPGRGGAVTQGLAGELGLTLGTPGGTAICLGACCGTCTCCANLGSFMCCNYCVQKCKGFTTGSTGLPFPEVGSLTSRPAPPAKATLDVQCGAKTYTISTGTDSGTCTATPPGTGGGGGGGCHDSHGNAAAASCDTGCTSSSGAGSCIGP